MEDDFSDLGPVPEDDGLDTEQITNADDLVNLVTNDDFDEGHRELFRVPPPEVYNMPFEPVLGKLAINGGSSKELRNRRLAMRQMAALNMQSGINVFQAEGELQPYMVRTRLLEDGTSIKSQSLGALSRTIIDVPEGVEPGEPGLPGKDEEEPTRSFIPFLWVGIHHLSGGDARFPDWGGYDAEVRMVYPHLVVYEPADVNNADGADHLMISNRHLFVDITTISGNHQEAKDDRADLEENAPTELYPDGPSITENEDTLIRDQSTLEVWVNPSIIGEEGGEYTYIDRESSSDVYDSDEAYWDVIIRSRRTSPDTTPVTDRSGAGSQFPRPGNYDIKVMMAGEWFIDRVNIHTTVFEMHVFVGAGTERRVAVYEVTLEAYTGYLSSILPGGWFKRLRSSDAWYQEWATQDFQQESVLQSFLSGSINDETHTPVPDRGTNGHGPWWWDKGVLITMPPEQTDVPDSQFIPPALYESAGLDGDIYRPDVTTTTPQFPEDSIWHPRVDLAPAAPPGQSVTQHFQRNTLQTVIGLLAFSGDQVKAKGAGAPESCTGDPPPSTLTMNNVFDGDPAIESVFGRDTTPPGIYRAVRGSSTITVKSGVSPGNGIDLWQEESCYGAVKDVRISVGLPPYSEGIQDLIDAPLNPLANPMILYMRGTSIATASNGDDYGDGQLSTTWNVNGTSAESTEGEWTAAGGPGGYFSAEFQIDDNTRVMEVY
jgi:hypothetical protein